MLTGIYGLRSLLRTHSRARAKARASEFMYFVYLDEFGHIGPYVERCAPKYNESPVFGVAGLILPENAVRPFATFFLKLKENTFMHDLAGSGKMAAKWEKKGTSFIRPKPLQDYVEARRALIRLLKKLDDFGGHLFFYGREKKRGLQDGLNPIGLYTTCFAHTVRRLNNYCEERDSSFVMVIDQHSARKELLETASKTMYGKDPCRRLASPPFEAESYLNQNVQAADWIATLVGRLKAFEVAPSEFEDYAYIKKIFGDQVFDLQKSSILEKRPRSVKKASALSNGPFSALANLKLQ